MSDEQKEFTLTDFRAASMLLARAGLAAQTGKTFGGDRDTDKALGYKPSLGFEDYNRRFRRNPVARRIVTAFPAATWRGHGELIEDEDPNVLTSFEEAWFELDNRLKIWATFKRADVLAGLGEYAIILLGAPGKLEEPLPTNLKPADLVYLQPWSQNSAPIERYDEDPASPRFGLPEFYTLKPKVAVGAKKPTSTAQVDRRVHWSRVIHIADGFLEDSVLGAPRLENVWNRLDDLEKIVGGGSEATWMNAHRGYHFDVDPEMKFSSAEAQEKAITDMKEQVDEFVHGMRRALRTRGVKVNPLGADVPAFDSNVDSVLKLISAGCEIPIRILLGSERGELASTEDRENWADRVDDRRSELCGPFFVSQFVDRMIAHGVLPEPDIYEIRWPMREPSEKEKAEIALLLATVNEKAGETVVTANEIRDRTLGLEPLDTLEDFNAQDEEVTVDDEEGSDEDDQALRAASGKRGLWLVKRKERNTPVSTEQPMPKSVAS